MDTFNYSDERFADIQMLRYRLNGFDQLQPRQRRLIYYLSEATLSGRDITFDQFGRYNITIRKTLEAIFKYRCNTQTDNPEFQALTEYLKCLWFASGIHHHYSQDKFTPHFSAAYLKAEILALPPSSLPLAEGQTPEALFCEIEPVVFDPEVMNKRVNLADGDDLLRTSACNYYQDISQAEAEAYYNARKEADSSNPEPLSHGLNSTLRRDAKGQLTEDVWHVGGKYSAAIERIVYWLEKAIHEAEEPTKEVIRLLIQYYTTGNLADFNAYCKAWVADNDSTVDFINGFIETYGDPLGLKGSWEGLVEYVDEAGTRRTRLISDNAQWFEDHSPVDVRFKKKEARGVSARVICAAQLGGDEYPATAIGINLPNADWIRAQHGSKSITIANITDAYKRAAHGNGFWEEFAVDEPTLQLIRTYDDSCDDLHTDLHECLGHGSGQLLPGVDPDALKNYASTIEEARADLFALYYIADHRLVELGLLPDDEAYKAQYYTYMANGLMTQLVRISEGKQIEEAHMRNRALIARWCCRHSEALRLIKRDGKTFTQITDYEALRQAVARLLAEVQRIKSEGDYEAARRLVEDYAVAIDADLHHEVLERYKLLNLSPYKGFINPWLKPLRDAQGDIVDVEADYSETYTAQMLRYSHDYATL